MLVAAASCIVVVTAALEKYTKEKAALIVDTIADKAQSGSLQSDTANSMIEVLDKQAKEIAQLGTIAERFNNNMHALVGGEESSAQCDALGIKVVSLGASLCEAYLELWAHRANAPDGSKLSKQCLSKWNVLTTAGMQYEEALEALPNDSHASFTSKIKL